MPPILILGSHLDLALARNASARRALGFVHASMTPDQLVRAFTLAAKAELVAPRVLIHHLIAQKEPANLSLLSAGQRKILELVVEGWVFSGGPSSGEGRAPLWHRPWEGRHHRECKYRRKGGRTRRMALH